MQKVLRFRATGLKIQDGWCLDNNAHIWSILSGNDNFLSEWNGERWIRHEIPSDLQKRGVEAVTIDTVGRIWLLPNAGDAPAAFCDSRDGKWQVFPTIEAAFEAVKSEPVKFEQDHLTGFVPEYSADRTRIAFRSRQQELSYFDGAKWRYWRRGPDFVPGGSGSERPFFSGTGALSIVVAGKTWGLKDDKWEKIETPASDSVKPGDEPRRNPRITPPEGCVTESPNSIALDNQGVFWLTWQNKLYKCVPGLCVEVFSSDEPDLFPPPGISYGIDKVWIDRHGNAFLKTGFSECVVIAPKSPPPAAPVITLEKTAPDSAVARFRGDARPGAQFRWRLDGEPWRLTKDKSVTLNSLPGGTHVVSAAIVDSELQTSPAATREFTVKIDPSKQIDRLIRLLSGKDSAAREAAVRALARQPAVALPALNIALEKAGPDQRWWITAAIQEVERAKGK